MNAFWEGILAGYGIAIPVGAIAILIVDMGLRRGFGAGFMAGAGAATADFIYALLAVVAGETIAHALAPYAMGLRIASAVVLLLLGSYGLWQARKINVNGRRQSQPTTAQNGRLLPIYTRFLGLTLLNPLTIAYFGALILGRDATATVTAGDRLLFVFGAAVASLSWQTALAGLGALANQHLSPRFQLVTSVIGNLIVIALGLRIVFQLL